MNDLADLLDELADEIPIPGGVYFSGLRQRARAAAERLRKEPTDEELAQLQAFRDAVVGWRETDWPKWFCRATAEEIVENANRVARFGDGGGE